jgi:branched-chain amino acid transport system permease protein
VLDLLVSGIIYGSIITLGAIGLTLMADILGFFNFSYGEFFSLGAYCTLFFLGLLPNWGTFPGLSFGWSMVVAIPLSMCVTVAVMLFADHVFFKKLRAMGATSLFLALASLGLSFMLRALIYIAWGPKVRYYTSAIQISWDLPLGILVKADEIFILISALVLVVLVYVFLNKTRTGKAMRAMSSNLVLAKASGIQTNRVISRTWVVAGILVSVAGTLYAIAVQLRPDMGWHFLIPLFVAVIMGGIGSFWGAMIGGMTIGISEELISGLLQDMFFALDLNVEMSVYRPAIAFVFVVVILLIRPYGILGKKEV